MNLVKDIYAYHYVSQGKTTVNGIDDDEEMKMTDVSDSEPAFYYKAQFHCSLTDVNVMPCCKELRNAYSMHPLTCATCVLLTQN